MDRMRFDFNNLMACAIGEPDGVTDAELEIVSGQAAKAFDNIAAILADDEKRVNLGLEWARLPFQDMKFIDGIQKLGDEIAASYDNVISLGIGGSYLGLKAAQDALRPAYYNDFQAHRGKRPRIYFEGNNLDPDTLCVLLRNLDPKKTFVIVISKSGETTETKAALSIVEDWLKVASGASYGRQIFAITDPDSGMLRARVNKEQAKDRLSFRNLSVIKGVGGRFSELNTGLLLMAATGIDIQEVLDGAAQMEKICAHIPDVSKNPALMYAAVHTVLYRKKHKPIAILMPFCETLKSTADWYVQLLAESLGKKHDRQGRVVNVGRTPISARGTCDLHSIQQNNIEGENNKVVTFIKVDRFANDIDVPETGDFLSGKTFSELIAVAQEATEWALTREKRPNCTITFPRITPFYWGAMLLFFEMATAFEGELLDVNAFDQPGVEGYKNYMYYKLGKPGLPKNIEADIKNNPLIKEDKYIL